MSIHALRLYIYRPQSSANVLSCRFLCKRHISTPARLCRGLKFSRSASYSSVAMAKRKSLSKANEEPAFTIAPISLPNFDNDSAPPPKRRASQRKVSQPTPNTGSTNPDKNANVLDAPGALRPSPDASEPDERMNLEEAGMDVAKQVKEEDNDSPLSDIPDMDSPVKPRKPKPKGKKASADKGGAKAEEKLKQAPNAKDKKTSTSNKEPQFLDPEAEGNEEADEEEIQAALSRPPPVNSDYLPLPWKGRLGYVCPKSRLECIVYSLYAGMFMHLSSLFEPPCVQLPHM